MGRLRKVPLGIFAAVFVAAISLVVVGACAQEPQAAQDPAAQESEWTPLFNGVDLTGWTPKIRGSELGLDSARTFRVEDGLLTVSYDGYDEFGGRFGHLFYETPFSNYRILIEYRFTGEQATGGATWALRNSGLMFHSQSPESMLPLQDFPISLEAQFLGGNGTDPRPTANLCTPGTHVEMDGELIENHCTNSTSETYHGDQWVTFEAEVLGDSLITHIVNGEPVISYSHPLIGGGTVNGFDPAAKTDGTPLTGGYISLQSESHPVQFRRVLIRLLEENQD